MAKEITVSHALGLSIEYLREGKGAKYGYDFCMAEAASIAARKYADQNEDRWKVATEVYWHVFADAAWILCTRGILRPGIKRWGEQFVGDEGYSFTIAGRAMLDQLDDTSVVVMQTDSLKSTLLEFETLFGSGFRQRALEAVSCRDSGAVLASCTMAGAAAEAVLLATAIKKKKDEDAVLAMYRSARGRTKILDLLAGSVAQHIRTGLKEGTGIISIWRDEASHGTEAPISMANADEALRQLLHLCQWVKKHWSDLTSP